MLELILCELIVCGFVPFLVTHCCGEWSQETWTVSDAHVICERYLNVTCSLLLYPDDIVQEKCLLAGEKVSHHNIVKLRVLQRDH